MTRTARAFFFAVIIVLLAGGAALCQQKNAGRAARQRFVAEGPQDSMSFDPAVLYDSGGSGAASVVIADINGDGKPDLIVVNNWNCGSGECATNGGVGVLLGNGDGTFGPTVNYSSGGGYAVSVAV